MSMNGNERVAEAVAVDVATDAAAGMGGGVSDGGVVGADAAAAAAAVEGHVSTSVAGNKGSGVAAGEGGADAAYRADLRRIEAFGFKVANVPQYIDLIGRKGDNMIVFDVETTGLIARDASVKDHARQPYVVQFSWMVYNYSHDLVLKHWNHVIRLPEGVEIPAESTEIHGITNEQMRASTVTMAEALEQFREDVGLAGVIVAHNLDFDMKMVQIEFSRNGFERWLDLRGMIQFCTMRCGEALCKLTYVSKYTGKTKSKFPKLVELYEHLFGEQPEDLHNSMVDILACLKCYLKMTKD